MSQAEVERFVSDIKGSADLQTELKANVGSIESVVSFATSKGYDISEDEARDYIQSQTDEELSDEELDEVAGGKKSSDVDVSVGDIVL